MNYISTLSGLNGLGAYQSIKHFKTKINQNEYLFEPE